MPINSTHPEYNKYLPQWSRCRDAVAGSDAVKGAKEKYLPRLSGQSNRDYKAYLYRALFFSVSGRSLDGLVGLVTSKPSSPVYDTKLAKYFEDSTESHLSFIEAVRRLCSELLLSGRLLALTDWPVDGGSPGIVIYNAESIINWGVNGQGRLLWAVLSTVSYQRKSDDRFELEPVTTFVHLHVQDNVYTVDKYDSDGKLYSSFAPTIKGQHLNYIPGVLANPNGISAELVKPPILDIVDVNLSQFITSADLEHGRHFTALPTPVVSGVTADTVLRIGSETAWAIPEKAEAYYMEFQGLGLASLEKAIDEKTSQMAQFSTRLMDTSTRGSEAVDTVRLRHSSEAATLSNVVQSVESVLTFLYGIIAESERAQAPVIELNKDFMDTRLTHSELSALTEAYVSGAIDKQTYFYNLNRGELVPKDKNDFNTDPIVDKSDAAGDE